MEKSFDKFKKKVRIEHLIKSLIYSVSLGAGLTFVMFAIFKRIPLEVNFFEYLLIGLLLSGGLFYYLFTKFMPTDIEIAKRLDRKLALKEKVQTMTEFKDKQGLLYEMQRQNALEELDSISVKKMPMKFSPMMVVTILISLGVCVGSFFVPTKEVEAEQNSSFTSSSFTSILSNITTSSGEQYNDNKSDKDKIDDIIQSVDDSSLSDEEKEQIKQELEDLKEELENSENRDQAIEDAKEKIDQIIDQANSKNAIGEELKKSSNELVSQLGEAIITADFDQIKEALHGFNEVLSSLNDSELVSELNSISEEIKLALENSKVDSSDELYAALDTFANEMKQIASDLELGLISDEEAHSKIEEALSKAEEAILKALEQQVKDEQTKEEIDKALDDLKNDPNGDDPNGDEPDDPNKGDEPDDPNKGDKPDDPNGDDPDDPNNNGAGGDGKNEYGSNDLIYSKDGESSEYGDVIDDYYTDVINGDTEGEIPEDIIDIIEDYFSILYGNGSGDGN